jgi:hypothetical protein
MVFAAVLPRAAAGDPYSVTLLWTAPGDDADTGRATRYELRYSTNAVGSDVAAWWNAARQATGLPWPSNAGETDSTVVRGLQPETAYTFVIRAFDEAGNGSPFSNVAVATTDPGPPAPSAPLIATADAAIHAYPNPAEGNQVHFVIHVEDPNGDQVQLRLFYLSGRVIADIADGSYPSGDTVISWPRLSRNGDRVAPGYYETIGMIGRAPVRERIILLP